MTAPRLTGNSLCKEICIVKIRKGFSPPKRSISWALGSTWYILYMLRVHEWFVSITNFAVYTGSLCQALPWAESHRRWGFGVGWHQAAVSNCPVPSWYWLGGVWRWGQRWYTKQRCWEHGYPLVSSARTVLHACSRWVLFRCWHCTTLNYNSSTLTSIIAVVPFTGHGLNWARHLLKSLGIHPKSQATWFSAGCSAKRCISAACSPEGIAHCAPWVELGTAFLQEAGFTKQRV